MRRRLIAALAIGGLSLAFMAGCSSDDSGGDESSTDTSADSGGGVTVPTDTGTPVAVEAGDISETEQYLTPVPDSVAAGSTTFTLTNVGNREHEMVVLKTDTPFDQLEINSEGKVSEDDSVGEVPETPEGESGSFTVDLEPGAYVLVCNIADHYGQGMRAAFTVTG
jgi:uncharacterized cupredoxin-like copper-binding protein